MTKFLFLGVFLFAFELSAYETTFTKCSRKEKNCGHVLKYVDDLNSKYQCGAKMKMFNEDPATGLFDVKIDSAHCFILHPPAKGKRAFCEVNVKGKYKMDKIDLNDGFNLCITKTHVKKMRDASLYTSEFNCPTNACGPFYTNAEKVRDIANNEYACGFSDILTEQPKTKGYTYDHKLSNGQSFNFVKGRDLKPQTVTAPLYKFRSVGDPNSSEKNVRKYILFKEKGSTLTEEDINALREEEARIDEELMTKLTKGERSALQADRARKKAKCLKDRGEAEPSDDAQSAGPCDPLRELTWLYQGDPKAALPSEIILMEDPSLLTTKTFKSHNCLILPNNNVKLCPKETTAKNLPENVEPALREAYKICVNEVASIAAPKKEGKR